MYSLFKSIKNYNSINSGSIARALAIFTVVILFVLLPLRSFAAAESELLKPDQAFRFTAVATAADMVQIKWDIAADYYLYKDKIRFTTDTPDVELGLPVLPEPSEVKADEFFGQMAIYRGVISIDLPVIRKDPNQSQEINLIATSQGCADLGICYPPHQQTAQLLLAAAPSENVPENSEKGGLLGAISKLTGKIENKLGLGQDEDFLQPDQAFVLSVDAADNNTLIARWTIADGYYLYRDKFSFMVTDPAGVTLSKVTMPAGKMKTDESFGRSEVYYKSVAIPLPLSLQEKSIAGQRLTLEVGYQGCADAGLCYPPIKKSVPVSLNSISASNSPASPSSNTAGSSPPLTEQDQYLHSLLSGNVFITMLSFFGVGLLLAFTPCMFPMIPILSSIIAGQGERITTHKAFLLSLFYVLAMAVTYTVAGIVAAAAGKNLQAVFQNPWILGSFSAIFVLLALSMFGFYNLQLPNSLQAKLTQWSNKQEGGTLIGASIMGFLSALIVGPCLAAPLAGALLYIAQTGDSLLGGTALFAMSIGMGVPLIIIGTSAGKLLPKAGAWMHAVKAVFGVVMLGVAIWMLERIIPAPAAMLLWAALLIVSGVYLGALDRLGPDITGWRRLWQGLGVIMLIYGGLLIVGASSGGHDVFQPLRSNNLVAANSPDSNVGSQHSLPFTRIKGLAEFERELALARNTNTPVMLDFYADWCVSCKEMEKYTFSDPKVQQTLRGVKLLQADVTANDAEDQALLKRFGIFGPPSILFFGPDGQEKSRYRLIGFMAAEEFHAHLLQALGDFLNPVAQKDYSLNKMRNSG